MNEPVQFFWHGGPLSTLERLSLRSFQAHGHPCFLYSYDDLEVPEGVTLCGAQAIIPERRIFKLNNSYAAFADLFRWRLLYEMGGWWADLDSVLLRPLDFDSPYVFSSERDHPNCGNVKVPAKAPLVRWILEETAKTEPWEMSFCDYGPFAIKKAIKEFKMEACVQPPETFCPIDWRDWRHIINRGLSYDQFPEDPRCYAVHLWASMWSGRMGEAADKNATYPETSLYERLKKRYLGNGLS